MIAVSVPTDTPGRVTLVGEPVGEHLLVTPSLDSRGYNGRWNVTVRWSGHSTSKWDYRDIADARDLAKQLDALGLDWKTLGPTPTSWPDETRAAVVAVLSDHIAHVHDEDDL